jgi:hypothetical protein
VHDFGLLTDQVQVRRSRVSYAEYDTGRFQKIIDELVQFAMRLSCMVTMQKHNYGQRLRSSLIRISDDEPNQFAESSFSSLIALGGSSLERNGFESFGQLLDRLVSVFCRQQIQLGVTVVAPMSNSRAIVAFEMIECGPEERFLPKKFRRRAKLWQSAFIADHDEPKSD